MEKINAIDNALIDEVAEINDNPWLVEGVRIKQVQKAQEKADQKKAALQSVVAIQQDLFESGRDDARFAAQQSLNQFNIDREFAFDQYKLMSERAESAINAQAKLEELQFQRGIDLQKLDIDLERLDIARLNTEPKPKPGEIGTPKPYDANSFFTKSQINNGVLNAGIPRSEFLALSYDVQNYFINSSTKEIDVFKEVLTNVANGSEDAKDVKNEIDNSNSTPEVKEYLKKRVDSVAPAAGSSGDWNRVRSFFEGAASYVYKALTPGK